MEKIQSTADDNLSRVQPRYLTLRAAIGASRSAFFAVGFFSFFINLLMLTGPLFMLQIYDRVLSSRSLPTLAVLFALVAALFVMLGLLEFVRSRILARIGAHVTQRIHERLFDSAMRLGVRTGGSNQTSAGLQELEVVQQYIAGPGFAVLFDAPWVPVYIAIIFLFDPLLGWLAVAAAIVLFFVALLNDWRARVPNRDASTVMAQARELAGSGQRNGEVLVSMGMLSALRERWSQKQMAGLVLQTKARDRAGTLSAFSKAFRLFVQSAMLATGAVLVIYGEISAGVMIAASIILGRALQPIEQAIVHWRGFVRYREAKTKLAQLLATMEPPQNKTSLPKPAGNLEVRELHVAAPGSKDFILRNINFVLPTGKILGVVGDSASGKTTLARVLTGVWGAGVGEVRMDGATFDQWHSDDIGRFIGYLPQDVELFDGTIAQNISRLQLKADPDAVIRAAQHAGVHDMIKHLGGYETRIGTKGSNLSAGQRQQIALARALYGDPSLIVLDEPNSNLDEKGERALFGAIAGMRKRKQSVVIIVHRKDILEIVDDLLILGSGKQLAWGDRKKVLLEMKERRRTRANNRDNAAQKGDKPGKPGFQLVPGRGSKWHGDKSLVKPRQPKGQKAGEQKN